ncbi:PfkB family carbohydrate kinase, partial [Vineibacter terrae]|uniref:PfkB family carbohydrate kinase n=1 Tax=Vineibacter terrae TaxID=2586908 RepID=UPI002E33688C
MTAMPAPKVIVVGSLNMDLIVRTPRRPEMGETVMGEDLQVLPGGKGLNQAVAAARLGVRTHMVGRVGEDDFGRRFLAFLAAEGIGSDGVRATADAPTGAAVVTLAGGDNAIIVAPGANMRLTPEEAADLPVAPGDICIGQLEVPMAATEAAFRRARGAGASTILNAAPAQALPSPLLEV